MVEFLPDAYEFLTPESNRVAICTYDLPGNPTSPLIPFLPGNPGLPDIPGLPGSPCTPDGPNNEKKTDVHITWLRF